ADDRAGGAKCRPLLESGLGRSMPPEQRSADIVPGADGSARSRIVSICSSDSREYPIDRQTVAIGSHPSNDVVLDDTTVSRRHATITRKPGRFELADLGSTNGTFVNGRRAGKPIALKSGDEIKFGSVRIAFDPASVPKRMRRGFAIMMAMFLAGFMLSRYRAEIGPVTSGFFARITPGQSSAAPSANDTQSEA